jgi:HD-like signal output (HDOD) protein
MSKLSSLSTDAGLSSSLSVWRNHLQALLGGPIELPPLSPAAGAVAAMAADPDANTALLAQHVQRDATIAANVLRVANSAAFAPQVPILSVQQAISWLGLSEILSIAVSVWVRGQVFAVRGHEKLISTFWQESVATASWAREIARLGRTSVELAHLCGLLHRIGRPVVVRLLAQIAGSESSRLTNVERSRLIEEFETRAGLALANAWTLPEPVVAAVAQRGDPNPSGDWSLQLRQVKLAELMAARMLEQTLDAGASEQLAQALDALNIYPEQFAALEARTDAVQAALSALA